MEVFCESCGSALSADTQFCSDCGSPTRFYYHSHGGGSLSKPTLISAFYEHPYENLPPDLLTRYGPHSPEELSAKLHAPLSSAERPDMHNLPDPYQLPDPYNIAPPPPPPYYRKKKRGPISRGIAIVCGVIVIPLLLFGGLKSYLLFTQKAENSSTRLAIRPSTRPTSVSIATPLQSGSAIPTSTPPVKPLPTHSATLVPVLPPTQPPALSPTAVAQPACGPAFSDAFKGSLHTGWNWLDPAGYATYNLPASGPLSITTRTNADLNVATNNNAPRLLQPVSGNFTVQNLVELPTNLPPGFLAAGILLWQDGNNFLRLERSPTTFDFEQEVNGVFVHDASNTLAASIIPLAQAELQLKRSGDTFSAFWRAPGQSWQYINTANVHLQNIQVGVFLVNQSNSQATAYYHYFTLICG